MAKSTHTHKDKSGNFWTVIRKWLAGLAGVVAIVITMLSQVFDFWKSNRPVNNHENVPVASDVRQMTNNEMAEFFRNELLETRMEITNLIIMHGSVNKNIEVDSIEIQTRPQPSRSNSR